ncbi:30S ribosomal protein S16 [bacterium]|nr:30S ribosomal protein S16 [bacterium]MBU1024452.1 30S ribosomal protein S16 [bacterium]
MSLKIRLKRIGMRKQPSYKIVVADARKPRDGKAVDILGTYSPQRKDKPLTLDIEKVDKWLSVGAQPTDAAKKIVDKARKAAEEQGVTKVSITSSPKAPKISKKKKDAMKKAEEAASAERIAAASQSDTAKGSDDNKSSD